MRVPNVARIGLALIACLLAGACAPNLKDVKNTLESSAIVGVAYDGQGIAMHDRSIEGRFGMRPELDVPEAYQAVGRVVRDALRGQAPGARVDLVDHESDTARAASDVYVRVNVDGAYFCDGGLVHEQTCTLAMRAQLLIEDRRAGTNTPLEYRIARRSAPIPGSENWAEISLEQAQRAVPPASLASILADEVRRDLDALLSGADG